jgi:hypothetical protein
LMQERTNQLAALAVSMRGNIATLEVPVTAALPDEMPAVDIPDEKWDLFCSSILKSEDGLAEMRQACSLFHAFSTMYDDAQKTDAKVSAFHAVLSRTDDRAALAVTLADEQQAARDDAAQKFSVWMVSRVTKIAAIGLECANVRVLLESYDRLLTCASAAIPPAGSANKLLKSFAAQLKQIEKAKLKVIACVSSCRNDVASLQQKVLAKKSQAFPDILHPAPADATESFDTAMAAALDCATGIDADLQAVMNGEAAFEEVRARCAAVPAPVRGGRGGGRGGRGTGRGGRGGGRGGSSHAAQADAADAARSSSDAADDDAAAEAPGAAEGGSHWSERLAAILNSDDE